MRTRKRDSVATLYDRIMGRSVGLVPRLVDDADGNRLSRKTQAQSGASYYSAASEGDFALDWREDAEQLRRWICATPGQCFCDIAEQRVFFLDAELEPCAGPVRAGTVIRLDRTCCAVATGERALRLRRARLESEGEKSVAQLCRELGIREGDRLA